MKIKKDFALRTVMGQHVIMAEGNNADSYGKILNLNKSAAMLWEKLKDRTFTIDDAAGILMDKYKVDPAVAKTDAAEIINLMIKKGLIDPE